MKQSIKLNVDNDMNNLLGTIKAFIVLFFLTYVLAAFGVCILVDNYLWLIAFVFGAIPITLLVMIPYYFAKIFVNMAQDISRLSNNNNDTTAEYIPLEITPQTDENKE